MLLSLCFSDFILGNFFCYVFTFTDIFFQNEYTTVNFIQWLPNFRYLIFISGSSIVFCFISSIWVLIMFMFYFMSLRIWDIFMIDIFEFLSPILSSLSLLELLLVTDSSLGYGSICDWFIYLVIFFIRCHTVWILHCRVLDFVIFL